MGFSPFIRQVYVAAGPQLAAVSIGGAIGFSCVLLQQLQLKESDIQPNLDTLTWIISMQGLAGIGGILMPSIMQLKGRKFSFVCSCLLLILGWSLAFIAKDAYTLLLAVVFLGFGSNCTTVVNLITVSEMLSPKYRTVSMMLLGITQLSGLIIVTSVGTLLHWKKLTLIMCSPVVVALLMMCLWPESPSWLAYKGKFTECEKAFTWLRGSDEDANRELLTMMTIQRQAEKRVTRTSICQEIRDKIRMKDFYLPSLHMILILLNFYICGGVCLVTYSKDIMETATGDEKAALIGFLMVDVVLFAGAMCSLIFIRYLKTKTILYIGGVCNVFLLSASLITVLQSYDLISRNPIIFISCYVCYSFFSHAGINTITFAVSIELMPVKHRGIGGALYNITTCFFHFATIKVLPYLVLYMHVWGTFLLFSMISLVCTLLIWRYIPETKGRTLPEIENYYNHGTFVIQRCFEDNVDVTTPIVKNNV